MFVNIDNHGDKIGSEGMSPSYFLGHNIYNSLYVQCLGIRAKAIAPARMVLSTLTKHPFTLLWDNHSSTTRK